MVVRFTSHRYRSSGKGAAVIQFTYTIRGAQGLHARPVVEIARAAGACESTVTVACSGRTSSGDDMMGLMALNANRGDELTITVDGLDEQTASEALKAIFTF